MNLLDAVFYRKSVRSYGDARFTNEERAFVEAVLAKHTKGPLGNTCKFVLLDNASSSEDAENKLGTYGFIKGMQHYIAGSVSKNSHGAFEDYGYCLEGIVLELTQHGYATCWLAGTFQRDLLQSRLSLSDSEIIPAITPVGFSAGKRRFMENLLRSVAGADNRKDPKDLLFASDAKTPFSKENLNALVSVFDSVRIGPSASNKQPWRLVVLDTEKKAIALCIDEDEKYTNAISGMKVQNLDMGIALKHFEVALENAKIKGSWDFSSYGKPLGAFKQVAVWSAN